MPHEGVDEIIVLLSFVLGEAFILLGIFIALAVVFNSGVLGAIGGVIYFVYIIWAIGQFFGEKRVINYIKSLLSYVIGVMTYQMLLILIAYLLTFV